MERPLKVAVYGAINAGKSSIINALSGRVVVAVSARGGETAAAHTHRVRASSQNRDRVELDIIDTPGIAEVNGDAKAKLAFAAALSADLVLFVLPADITNREMQSLTDLRDQGKPLIVALNKIDQFDSRGRTQSLAALHKRLDSLIGEENLVPIAAAPRRRMVFVHADGAEREEMREMSPDIALLERRIVAIARTEGRALQKLADLVPTLQAVEADRRALRKAAEETVDSYAMAAAAAVALNPIPWLDVAGGSAAIVMLVLKLEAVYRQPLDPQERSGLAGELWRGCRSQLALTIAAALGGSFVKTIPGIGTFAGGAMQAGAAGYLIYVVGRTAMVYMENGKTWKAGGAEAALKAVIASVDKASVTARIVAHVKTRMGLS
jgi:small GTP-binding protein